MILFLLLLLKLQYIKFLKTFIIFKDKEKNFGFCLL